MRFGPYNDIRWLADEQFGALSFQNKSAPTPNGLKDWLVRAGNPSHESGIGWDQLHTTDSHLRLRHYASKKLNISD